MVYPYIFNEWINHRTSAAAWQILTVFHNRDLIEGFNGYREVDLIYNSQLNVPLTSRTVVKSNTSANHSHSNLDTSCTQ